MAWLPRISEQQGFFMICASYFTVYYMNTRKILENKIIINLDKESISKYIT